MSRGADQGDSSPRERCRWPLAHHLRLPLLGDAAVPSPFRPCRAPSSTQHNEILVNQLRKLGTAYGVAVRTYGLSANTLDSLPSADKILLLTESDFESNIAGRIDLKTLVSGRKQATLDWNHLQEMRQISSDFANLLHWIEMCIDQSRALTFSKVKAVVDSGG
jgi:hypothetical protein